MLFLKATLRLMLLSTVLVSVCLSAPLQTIRIGWQTSWATQAQLAMTLKKTDVLAANGLEGKFFGFSYGGPLSEAALAEQIDVLFAADQPAINLIARGADWSIIGKCVSFRDALLVPVLSSATTVSDLRGGQIAVPFGSGAHRVVMELLKGAGLTVGKDVTLLNLDVTEINSTIEAGATSGNPAVWRGNLVAAANWDPNIASFQERKLARVLVECPLFGVTAMSNRFIRQHREAAIGFLVALHESLAFYSRNMGLANMWYLAETGTKVPESVLLKSASYDANLQPPTAQAVDVSLTPADVKVLQTSASFALDAGLIKKGLLASRIVDGDLLKAARQVLTHKQFEPSAPTVPGK